MQGGYFASLAAAQFMVQEDARASMALPDAAEPL
jgi:ATP-binding cassette subfamily B protein